MSIPYSTPEAIDSFVPPDVLKVSPKCTDLAKAFQDYRDVMDYNSRLILVLAWTEKLAEKTRYKLAPVTDVRKYTVVCVLLTTRRNDCIHLDRKVWDSPHCGAIRAQVDDVYNRLLYDHTITDINRNFRIMHMCIGHELFKLDAIAMANDRQFLADGGAFVKEYVPNFIREQDAQERFKYPRTAHAYYTSCFRVLMRFIATHLEMIVEDIGIPELLPLVKEDEEKDNKLNFITLKEQSRRMLTRRKEALEAELRKINAALSSQASNAAKDGTH